MARDTAAVTTLVATVQTRSPLHIGGLGAAVGQDAPVARDASGRPIMPGTSITGALRGALDHASDKLADETSDPCFTWGDAEDKGHGASRVVVHDALLTPHRDPATPGDDRLGRRDGVAIDRAYGSAADGLLYGREVIPAGWWATIVVEIHSSSTSEKADLDTLAAIRHALTEGISFGARTSRGLGEVKAAPDGIKVTQRRYNTPDAFWATRRTPAKPVLPQHRASTEDVLDITIDWAPNGPIAVGAGAATASLSFLPVLEPGAEAGRLRLVLPGTSIAGALRSRAELVCRTLTGKDTPAKFTDQLADSPLVATTFGLAAGTKDGSWSALQTADCVSVNTVAADTWHRAVVPAEGKQSGRSVTGKKGAELRRTEHVAIDRWTGGASDGRLFSEYEPHGFAFEPLRLRLHLSRIKEGQRDLATMLLLIAVRELAEGRVPLGGRTRRGYGAVTVTKITLAGAGLDHATEALDLYAGVFADLRKTWQAHHQPAEEAS